MTSIDTYLDTLDPAERTALERVRKIIKEEAPDAVEVISYGMPGFKYRDKYLAGFNAFKGHLSFFPTAEPIAECQEKLSSFTISKGTVQFTPDHPIPDSLIKDMLKVRLRAIIANSKTR